MTKQGVFYGFGKRWECDDPAEIIKKCRAQHGLVQQVTPADPKAGRLIYFVRQDEKLMEKTLKPILEWDLNVFLERMKSLGFSVKFIEKPETIPNMKSIDGENLDSLSHLDQNSKERVQAYLDEKGADGALKIDKKTWRVDGKAYQSIEMADVTVQPYKLSKISGDE